jgi:NTP pyrophosphatase (non-canonical NTP hydrolase)
MSIDNFAYEVQCHADRLFPKRTPASMFMKLFSEIGELVEAQSEEEYADVMIMLLDYGSKNMFKIEHAIRKKMAINDARKWEINELGVARHVE